MADLEFGSDFFLRQNVSKIIIFSSFPISLSITQYLSNLLEYLCKSEKYYTTHRVYLFKP